MRPSTSRATENATIFLRLLALGWLVPALIINVNWGGETPLPWNLAAAMSIVAAALFIEAAVRVGSWLMSPLFALVALLLVLSNFQTAFGNLNHASDQASDHRKSSVDARSQHGRTRSQLAEQRSQVVLTVGEQPTGSISAEIAGRIAGDARRWQATSECDPLFITAGPSRTFCAGIADLRAKEEAAKKRDELDAKIADVDAKLADVEVVTSVDPYGDAIAQVLLAFGIRVSADVKAVLSTQRDVTRALALELMATFGPSAWLLFVATFTKVTPRRRASANTAAKPAAMAKDGNVIDEKNLDAFIAEAIEPATGTYAAAGTLWKTWQAWCTDNDKFPGTQKPFGQLMKQRFEHQANSGRPRYVNVRLKPRLVAQAVGA